MLPMPHTRPILQAGNPVLRARSRPIPKKDFGTVKLKRLIHDMSAALAKEEHGVALAAPQIGASVRLFIVSKKILMRGKDAKEAEQFKHDLVFINPEILRRSRSKKELHEGCLSVAGVYGWIKRHDKTSVKAFDVQGKPFTYHGSGLMAEIFQHEIDHLDGILFIDKVERLETPHEA